MAATLAELKGERQTAYQKCEQIIADAKANSDGILSAEQRVEYDKSFADFEAKDGAVKAAELDAERAAKLAAAMPAPAGRRTAPDPIGGKVHLANQREGFKDDPKRGFKNPAEFLTSLMKAQELGRVEDPRLKYLAAGADEAGGHSDPYGGFLLPTGFSPNLMSVGVEGDPTVGRTQAVPMNTQSLEIPARVDKNHTSSVSGGLQVYRRNETDTSTATRMELEQVKLTATMLFGIAYATEELLARSPISFITLLQSGMSDEFAAKLLKEKLFGTGAGQYEGVINSACVVSQAKETGQAAATIVYENVIKMRSRCWRYGDAIWIANHDTLPQLMRMSLAVGTGGSSVWQPSAREDAPDMLLGRPLFFSEFAETVGTQGDIICGNWTQYLEGTLSGPQSAESMHVRFINHERTFKFWLENDGKPWWRSALTPNKSSTTLSPFVVLDARA